MNESEEVLDARQAAEYLGLHVETVRRLAREAKIPAYRVGGVWRFSKSFLRRWAESQQQAIAGTRTVLVVDDEEVIRSFLGRLLRGEGFQVRTAASGAEALQVMAREMPDVVLLDLRMPGMDGAALLRRIRELHGDVPVVVITGYPDSHLVAEALECSPFMLLAKPIEPEKLLRAVRMALGAGRAQRK